MSAANSWMTDDENGKGLAWIVFFFGEAEDASLKSPWKDILAGI